MEKKEQVFLYMKEEIERLANLEEEKMKLKSLKKRLIIK